MSIKNIKNKVVQFFALRWLRGKAKEGGLGKILKALDGWKLFIAVGVLFGVRVYDQASNGHAGDIAGMVMAALGWLPPGDWTGESMTAAAASALALFGWFAKLYKAQQQLRAGAKPTELLSAEGFIKAEIAKQK